MLVQIPVSVGELFDKVTILRIKAERLTDEAKRANVTQELALLEGVVASLSIGDDVWPLVDDLQAINATLWDVEDGKRACEREQRFDDAFIALARKVYIDNDRRAAIKKAINLRTGSVVVEEKSYE